MSTNQRLVFLSARKAGNRLETFVIYENPRDYPGKFVVRKWQGLEPDIAPLTVCESLEIARSFVPPDKFNLGRHKNDDPAIREVWI